MDNRSIDKNRKQFSVCQGRGEEVMRSGYFMGVESSLGMMTFLDLDRRDGCTML